MARIADADGNLTGVVVMGQATSNLWFDLVDGQYVARFSATERLVYYPDELVYRLTDLSGNVTEFGSFDIIASGMFLSRTDPAGNVTQVVSLADNGGNVGEVQRSDGSGNIESYLYTYSQGVDGILRVTSVLLRRSSNGGLGWTNVRQALYDYYSDGDVGGSLGDLRTVTLQAWNGLGWGNMGTTLYRYYQSPPYQAPGSSSSSSSSSGGTPEYLAHLLKYVVNADSYARLAADPNAGSDPANAPDWVVAQYADNYFEFDTERRVTLESVEGGSRTYLFSYAQSGFMPGFNVWATKTTETLPGGTQNITFANYAGQVMLSVKIPAAGQGAGPWYAYYRYDVDGRLVVKAESSAVAGYDESYADLLNCQPVGSSSSSSSSGVCDCPPICSGNLEYLADHTGLIHLYDYDPASGQVIGERIRQGEFGCDNKLWERSYEAFVQQPASSSSSSSSSSGAPAPLTVYQLSQSIVYPDDITVDPAQSRQIVTSYAYTLFPGTVQVQGRTTTWPVVPASQNGSGIADSRVDFFDEFSNATWSKDERGYIQYRAYDVATGGLVQSIEDVDTTRLSGAPAGWSTPAGGGLHLITDYTLDSLGRTTQVLGPAHSVDIDGVATTVRTASWTAYLDDEFTVYTAQGYQTGVSPEFSYTLVNPVSITISDAAGRVTDQISAIRASTSGALSASDLFSQSSYCRWTTNQFADGSDLSSTRVYYSIPASGAGVEGVNFIETRVGYDFLDRRNRLVSPGGTITRTLFDARNQPTAVWVGTNDAGATDTDPTGGGASGNNMVLVTEYEYDGGLAGLNGNRTSETQHVDASTTRVTAFAFDWRDRPVQVMAAQDTYQVSTLDNPGRATRVDRHAQAGGTLIGRSQTFYDDRGRVYQTITFGVDPGTGEVGAALTDNNWYDPSGRTIKQLPSGSSAFTKSVFDGAGRQTTYYYGYDLASGESSYSSASDVSDDTIVEQTETAYDDASNVTQTISRQRYHNATGTGPLSYPGGSQPVARVSYVAHYADPIGREQAVANYGTNGGTALVRPSTIPAPADTVLVSGSAFNSRGEAYQSIDPAGKITQTVFDDAGRRTELVQNYLVASSSSGSSSSTGGLPVCDDQNITTLWSYTPDGQTLTFTAVNSATGDQVTTYGYGTMLAASDVARSDLLSAVTYPDGGVVSYLVNRQGQTKQFTDQRLVIHAYDFDLLGRQTEDRVISLGGSSSSSSGASSSSGTPLTESFVDGTVQRISRTYDVRGLLHNVTSYSSPIVDQGTVVNDVQRVYNSFGQLIIEYQEHTGAVNISTSVNVQYAYADGSANTIRPTQLIYPNGRVLYYDYGTAGGIDNALSRVASLVDSDGTTHLVDYTRLGAHTSVQSSLPGPQISWSLIGTGTDPYTGFDQFGRVVDNRWYSVANNADLDRIQHGYDRAGNRLWRKSTVAEAAGVYFDELYSLDGLYRLADLQRGQLNASNGRIISGTLTFAQNWCIDATGNWGQFWQNDTGTSWDLQQSRDANRVNEITSVSGGSWEQPAYDEAGNMVQMPQVSNPSIGSLAVWDAWNRLTEIWSNGSLSQQNAFDGTARRITKLVDATLRQYYFSAGWQSLEERLDSSASPDRQFVWGQRYIDDLVLRDRGNERFYALQDANWNVTGLCGSGGSVSERYAYAAYGQPIFLNAAFTAIGESAYGWETLFAGYRSDGDCAMYLVRQRYLHQLLGCWLSTDPMADDRTNLYQYCRANPLSHTDPEGLSWLTFYENSKGQLCGYSIWLMTGSWCADPNVVIAAANAYDKFVSCWCRCEVTTHKCLAGQIFTATEIVAGTISILAARVPKSAQFFKWGWGLPNYPTATAGYYDTVAMWLSGKLGKSGVGAAFSRSCVTTIAKGGAVVAAYVELGIAVSCSLTCR